MTNHGRQWMHFVLMVWKQPWNEPNIFTNKPNHGRQSMHCHISDHIDNKPFAICFPFELFTLWFLNYHFTNTPQYSVLCKSNLILHFFDIYYSSILGLCKCSLILTFFDSRYWQLLAMASPIRYNFSMTYLMKTILGTKIFFIFEWLMAL